MEVTEDHQLHLGTVNLRELATQVRHLRSDRTQLWHTAELHKSEERTAAGQEIRKEVLTIDRPKSHGQNNLSR
eukprot:12531661-Prorocentrum_lima.AAC.1